MHSSLILRTESASARNLLQLLLAVPESTHLGANSTPVAPSPFQIEFDNKDASVPHNVDIHDASGTEVFKGEIFPGPAKRVYDVPALDAGAYAFACTVHPTMTGTLTVQ